jgi:plastocyanin
MNEPEPIIRLCDTEAFTRTSGDLKMNSPRKMVSIVRRLMSASLVALALFFAGAPVARADTIQIDGVIQNKMVKWVVGTSPATDVAVKPGDTIIWRAVSGKHGVVFDTQADAEKVLQFEAGGGLPALGPQTVGGEKVWGSAPQDPAGAGTTLARAKVKAGVAPGTKLGFFCSQHGRAMKGSLAVPGAPAGKTVQIDGVIQDKMVKWVVGTNPATDVAVKPGDTIIWKAVSGKHGVVFDTQAAAEAVLQFDTGGGLPALGPQTVQGDKVWGTAPQDPAGMGTTLARATVKAGVAPATKLGFFCSQHGRAMKGSLAVPGTGPQPTPSPDDSPVDPGGLGNPKTKRVVRAEVVALDQAFLCNRLGAAMPQGMIFALKRDVVNDHNPQGALDAGCVTLRPGKRPRPIVLRANVGDCLEITFTNLLCPTPRSFVDPLEQPATRSAGVHVAGMELIGSINSDASFIGLNLDGLTAKADKPCGPGKSKLYRFFARVEGTFLLYSTAADIGKGIGAGQLTAGLFGSVVVEPEGAEWYRSQVTQKDLELASKPQKGKYGHPILDYDAVYPAGTTYQDLAPDGKPKAEQTPIPRDTPILSMTRKVIGHDGKPATTPAGKPIVELVHSDLTAIITGPNRGLLPDRGGRRNPVYPDARQPYREFSIHYHDAPTTVQAFKPFNDDSGSSRIAYVLSAGRDLFAINYGMAGIGAEIWANRIKVGPMARSAEAKFEEFFLSSWVVGDPAMIVDRPANLLEATKGLPCGSTTPENPFPAKDPVPDPKLVATKAFYPDDPSNVYHSYLNDHVRFRVLHAGGNITHVHHLHAHQWLRAPDGHESLVLDSQTITPGDGFTHEILYGSGNRNLTVGDSIFHCHFYPHFAEGMWSLWRSHDVFEAGTKLDSEGRVAANERALPDGEIERGTPIPAIVPIPTLPMAPMPAPVRIVKANDPEGKFSGYKAEVIGNNPGNPGYPFFIPGVGGRRAPHPPLDFAVENGKALDGGLPRHIILNGGDLYEKHNAYDFTKELGRATAVELPEDGTAEEKLAMDFHEQATHDTDTPEGGTGKFRTNGKKRASGAPYAEPTGGPYTKKDEVGKTRVYKAANIQLDVVFSKKGWHFPQQRILTLWGDVKATRDGTRRPEPFFFRANSGDVIEFWQANLVPSVYELDDFQVRTPTDVIGQHIHLVKFDVTSSDGGANGFNYEDGTFSPDEVRERIGAINNAGGLYGPAPKPKKLTAEPIPFFGPGDLIVDDNGKKVRAWDGAQVTIQRWYVDPIMNYAEDDPYPAVKRRDRTLRTVFTHDHLSPSTHQQAGLYAGLLVEPRGSSWNDSATGAPLYTRTAPPYDPKTGKPTRDGGPTTWQAIIAHKDPDNGDRSFREFALELQDSSLAYLSDSPSEPKPYKKYGDKEPIPVPWGWMTFDKTTNTTKAINPPTMSSDPVIFQPALITTGPEPGIRTVNYRSEPAKLRYLNADNQIIMDPSHAFSSIPRNDPLLDRQPPAGSVISPGSQFKFSEPYLGAGSFDPYTPLLRAYENDDVQVRVLIGAHFLPHAFNLHGLKWLNEADDGDSGYVSTQVMSISEHFEMNFRLPPTAGRAIKRAGTVGPPTADYLYLASSDNLGLNKGDWGLLRAYRGKVDGLVPLPTNKAMAAPKYAAANIQKFLDGMAAAGKVQTYEVYAVALATANPTVGGLVYYDRGARKLIDPDALAYVLAKDYNPATDTVLPSYIPEPLVLRANAGDVIRVRLHNRIRVRPDSPLLPRQRAGMHAQLLSYDVTTSDGFNAGNNPNQTAEKFGDHIVYQWYAGNLKIDAQGAVTGQPVEFGAICLSPSDPFNQFQRGLFGALVIEPEDSKWQGAIDVDSRAQATITMKDKSQFREFVLAMQDAVTFPRYTTQDGTPVVLQAFNYRTEPIALRIIGFGAADFNDYNLKDISNALSDMAFESTSDPQTPIFHAPQGLPVRFRVVHPGGTSYTPLVVHGHAWKWRPLRKGTESRVLGDDSPSLWLGCLGATPPNSQFNLLIANAGGSGQTTDKAQIGIPGDYLYRAFQSGELTNGLWGVLRVGLKDKDDLTVQVAQVGSVLSATGRVWKKLNAPNFAKTITLLSEAGAKLAQANIDPLTGNFRITATGVPPTGLYSLQSSDGGTARIRVRELTPIVLQPRSLIAVPTASDNRLNDARRFLPQNQQRVIVPRR